MSSRAVLYTEMVVESTVNHCSEARAHAGSLAPPLRPSEAQDKLLRYLDYPVTQHPLVLQLGGSDARALGSAAVAAARFGYDELNLNCGCPSPRVAGRGAFGAALMTSPSTVGAACAAMRASSGLPVTVKCRTGVDDRDSYEELCDFVETVAGTGGVRHFVVHARKALLDGLSPEENRKVPPLQYSWVYDLATRFPQLQFTLNGGVTDLRSARAALQLGGLAGVMLGRAAWERPWEVLSDVDRALYGAPNPCPSRRQLIGMYCAYADAVRESEVAAHADVDGGGGVARFGEGHPRVRALVKPLLNLFAGVPRGKQWRAVLDGLLLKDSRARGGAATSVTRLVYESLAVLPDAALDAPPPDTQAVLAAPAAASERAAYVV
jgi:tRNA-dihydrouridine synthase A